MRGGGEGGQKTSGVCFYIKRLDCNPNNAFFAVWTSPRNESFHRYLNSFVLFLRRRSIPVGIGRGTRRWRKRKGAGGRVRYDRQPGTDIKNHNAAY